MQQTLIQTGGGLDNNCAYEGAHNMLPPSDCGKFCCGCLEVYRYDGCSSSMCGLVCTRFAGECVGAVVGSVLGHPFALGPPLAQLCSCCVGCAGQLGFMCKSRPRSACSAPSSWCMVLAKLTRHVPRGCVSRGSRRLAAQVSTGTL
eukprot:COSAG02_NODE_25041_length_670_cov_1.073555_1_plen_145_part_10